MDLKDNAILNLLLENSRLSCREMAKKVGCSVVTIINHLRELEQQGVIKNYSVSLDYEKLGYDITALIKLRISRGRLIEVEKKIAIHPQVFAVYDITGDFDSVVLAKFRSRKALDAFLKKIQTYDFVERTETNLILNIIKERNIPVE